MPRARPGCRQAAGYSVGRAPNGPRDPRPGPYPVAGTLLGTAAVAALAVAIYVWRRRAARRLEAAARKAAARHRARRESQTGVAAE